MYQLRCTKTVDKNRQKHQKKMFVVVSCTWPTKTGWRWRHDVPSCHVLGRPQVYAVYALKISTRAMYKNVVYVVYDYD